MSTPGGAEPALAALLEGAGAGPVLVHGDLLRAGRAGPQGASREAQLDAHLDLLHRCRGERALWMPAFNYGFTRDGRFDVRTSPSQVGPLAERFRLTQAAWRTPVPVFSVCGTHPAPAVADGPLVDPFDERSCFAALAREDGTVLFYGAGLGAATLIHHAERTGGGPVYRYDKDFPGTVTGADGTERAVTLRYHVRPLGRELDYDFPRLQTELEDAGLARRWERGLTRLLVVSARGLLAFWRQRLADDPLHLLDAPSRAWVEPLLEQLGRPFVRADFESA